MKNKILLTIFSAFIGAVSFGQTIEIRYEGAPAPTPEATVDGTVGGEFAFKGYYVVNVSGEEVSLSWTRSKLFGEACMSDQVCTDESCYTPFDDGVDFNSPENATIPVGDSIYFKVGASSLDDPCCGIYRYSLKTGIGVEEDYITIKYRIGDTECFLSTEEEMIKEEISVFPNPANNVLNVTLESTSENVGIKIFNVVGDLVLADNLVQGQNQVNVENLPNGVYFYSIHAGEELIETKKLVVRH